METTPTNQQPVVVWVHGDCLSPYHPALQAYPDALAIFVFDDELLRKWKISLKRITFLYECLLELPVVIRRGDVAAEVIAFARSQQASRVITSESVSPRFGEIATRIKREIPLTILPVEPFVQMDGHLDLKRFSRYWQAVEPHVFGQKRLFDQ
ncbi:MAG: hypothetical protein Fur005_00560 [Roseiflexaceae bacterium]